MEQELAELVGFLRDEKSVVRKGAVDAVLGLAASDDGRALLRGTKVVEGLRRLLGDRADIAEAAVSALVNLSTDSEGMEAILRASLTSGLLEGLRDPECTYKRAILMLLTNLSQTPEGCDQLMQKGAAGGVLMGLHFRRLLQIFITSGRPGSPGGAAGTAAAALPASRRALPLDSDPSDELEHAGSIVHNLTQLCEARDILLEPERGILPALVPQLVAASVTRRRAAAGMLRNCCGHTDPASVEYLLSPAVDVVTALLGPLAGPDVYTAGEKEGMHHSLYAGPGGRKGAPGREGDPLTRRLCLDALALLAVTRPGREHLRRVRAYPVVRTFHQWLEGRDAAPPGGTGSADGGEASSRLVGCPPPASSSAGGDGAAAAADDDDDASLRDPDDAASVDAIHRLVQQLFRDDEVKYTYEVTGRHKPVELGATGEEDEGGRSGEQDDDLGPLPRAQADQLVAKAKAAAAAQEAESVRARMYRYATVPLESARRIAADVSHGRLGGPTEAELAAVDTQVPDWTEDDPQLPPAFGPQAQPAVAEAAGSQVAGDEGGCGSAIPTVTTALSSSPRDDGTSSPAASEMFSAVERAGLGGID